MLGFFWQKYSSYGSGSKSETASNNDWGVPDVGMTSLTDYWLIIMDREVSCTFSTSTTKKRTVGHTEILGTNMNKTIFLDILGSFRNPFEGQHHLKRIVGIDKFILSQKSDSKQLCALSSLSWPQLHQFCSSAGLWPGEMQGILVVLMATWDTWARNFCV